MLSFRLRSFIPLLILCSVSSTPAVAIDKDKNLLPQIATAGVTALSIEKEKTLGDLMMRQLRAQAPVISDPLLDDYLNDIGNRLVAHAQDVRYPFEFFWINSPDINAFAFFGGHIGVHTGLIANADNESELASVLAHEIAHVTQRHIARRIEAQQRNAPLSLAGMIGGLLLALANPEAGIAAVSATQAANAQFGINYTRKNEQEADVIGLKTLASAGYNMKAAESFFSKLAEKYRMQTRPPAFLLTHPLPESRIAEIRARVNAQAQRTLPESLSFNLAKARVTARYINNEQINLELFKAKLTSPSAISQMASFYGLALTYFELREFDKAYEIINQLLEQNPNNLFFLDTATDIFIAKQHYDKAIELLEKHQQRLPNNPVITLNLANVYIEAGKYELAITALRDFMLLYPKHSLARNLLTTAYAKSQNMAQMHQSRAELYALMAAYPRAIDELHTAYNYSSLSDLDKKRIQARIKQLKQEQDDLSSF